MTVKNITYKEIPNELESTPFSTESLENLKLQFRGKKYTYKDEPKLFLELLLIYFAGNLLSTDKFHPLFIGAMAGTADSVLKKVSARLAALGTKYITTEELVKMWPGI